MYIDMNDISDASQYSVAAHPGEILLYEYMEPAGISESDIARAMSVPLYQVNEIIKGERRISADTALRLSMVLAGTTVQFWLNVQNTCDILALEPVKEKICREVVPLPFIVA